MTATSHQISYKTQRNFALSLLANVDLTLAELTRVADLLSTWRTDLQPVSVLLQRH